MRLKLIQRREVCCLTWRGRVLVLVVIIALGFASAKSCVPFLSINDPIPAEVLVVEGWLPDYALEGAAREFHRGGYKYVITAGSPLLGGYYLSNLKTSADLAAATLLKLGLTTNQVVAVPAPMVMRERSLAHAKAVRDWAASHDPNLRSINIYSLGVHTRRTRLLFERAFGKAVQVGSIAHPDAAYDSTRWWNTSEGFRTVTEEALGYFWTKAKGSL